MVPSFRRTSAAIACGAALFAAVISDAKAADGADEFYKGKQIRLIVSADPGAA
jgi:hypothetical protein